MANRVIDADGHICEPPALWNDYIEKKHRADAIRVERDSDGRDWISINGRMRRNLRPAAACVPWGMDDPDKVPSWEDILPGSYDGGARAKVLEEEGIERSLLFPSLYMLAGDTGASNIDPYATGPTADNQWVAEGPHIMVIVADPGQLEGLPTDPNSGGAYVMWKGTPYAHIMIPVAQRPAAQK